MVELIVLDLPSVGVLINQDSLVRYCNPIVICTTPTKLGSYEFVDDADNSCKGGLTDSIEEVLNCIVPPREWVEHNVQWRQTVSCEPATRDDVINLCKKLDIRLEQEGARNFGICPIRSVLLMQCFDEIIRQVSVSCVDRGLLLLRARDEIRKALDTYQTVFESSIIFSLHIAAEVEQQKSDIIQIANEQDMQSILLRELSEVNALFKQLTRDLNSQLENEQTKNSDEISFLKKTNDVLSAQYEDIFVIKK